MRLVKQPGKWATLLYPKRLAIFDLLNKNVLYNETLRSLFGQAKEFPDRFSLYEYLNKDVIRNEPIQYLEFGVSKGNTIRKWTEINTHSRSRFYGFDSFEGLPEDWNKNKPKGTFSTGGQAPELQDSRTEFIKGRFQQTLYGFLENFDGRGRIVMHVDCDLYSSALFSLTVLDRFVVPGSIVLFDEFRDLENEFAAFLDYTRAFYRSWQALAFAEFHDHVALLLTK